MTTSELKKLVISYEDKKRKLKEINDLIIPKRPQIKKAYTIPEWNEYNSEKQSYDLAVKRKGKDREDIIKSIEDLKVLIISAIPASNVWFVLEEDVLAVGHRSNDWPSSKGDILINHNVKTDDLIEIRHQKVN